jgi:hypothetical protein
MKRSDKMGDQAEMNREMNDHKGKKMMGGANSGHMGVKGGVNIEKHPSYYTKGFVAGRKAGQK